MRRRGPPPVGPVRRSVRTMAAQKKKSGVAIVTGAMGGMGSASAKQLAAQRWPLILCDLDAGRLKKMAVSLRRAGRKVEFLAGDIADRGFPDRLIAALGDRPVGAAIHA